MTRCSGCRQRLVTCPECRAWYTGYTRDRYAGREAQELRTVRRL